MTPRSRHIPKIAGHIANYLNTPDIMFVQEISDDSGSADDGVVSANKTLSALVNAIAHASDGVKYDFMNIPPVNNMDGGKPGSNIRVAYLCVPGLRDIYGSELTRRSGGALIRCLSSLGYLLATQHSQLKSSKTQLDARL